MSTADTSTKPVTTCTRAADFSETHEYVVTLVDGTVVRIFRDTQQFGHAVWHVSGEDSPWGIGQTKQDAIETLERRAASKVSK